ncbi:hypothetical protein WN943_026460 [Citrus x changshan-huyou]
MINHNLDVASVNVVVDTPEHYYLEDAFDNIEMIEADVHCVGCNMLLGQTIIAVDSFHERLVEGRLMLELRKLLYWNGEQVIDAITLLPPEPEEDD